VLDTLSDEEVHSHRHGDQFVGVEETPDALGPSGDDEIEQGDIGREGPIRVQNGDAVERGPLTLGAESLKHCGDGLISRCRDNAPDHVRGNEEGRTPDAPGASCSSLTLLDRAMRGIAHSSGAGPPQGGTMTSGHLGSRTSA
jgi:hypothetical protein